MSAGETARKNLELARDELVMRIRLRDQVLIVYLGFVGAAFGFAFGNFRTT